MKAAPLLSLSKALVAVVVLATITFWIATEDARLALAPMAIAVIAWALVVAPPHRTALVVFFLAIVADNPKEHPAEGLWISPLHPLGVLLYENIPGIHVVCMDLLLMVLVALALVRPPREGAVRPPSALHRCVAIAWMGVMWIEIWGLSRGGDLRATVWQIRGVLWAPAIAYVFATSLRGPRDHPALGKAIVLSAMIKAGMGIYYYEVVCRAEGRFPAYTNTHSDTILFVTALVIAMTLVLERPKLRSVLLSLAIVLPVGLAIVVNNRRLAYIDLAGACVAFYLVLPHGRLRRIANETLLTLGPVTAVYLAIGWRSTAAIFVPATKVASLFSKEDRSAMMRDIENYNLLQTWKTNLLFGSGFGHEYHENTRPEGIERIFPIYRFVAHNSVLWLESAGGAVGFSAFWVLLAALAYFAARSYRFAVAPIDRAAALTALSVSVTYGIQAYGDMGIVSWTGAFALGAALAVAAKLAVATGAFPAPALVAPRAVTA